MAKINQQVENYLSYCAKVRQMSPTTLKAKRSICRRFMEVTGLQRWQELTNEVYHRWVAHEKARGVSARSINTYNATILAMVQYQREMGAIIPLQKTLLSKLKEARPRRNFYTASEIAKVLKLAHPETRLLIKVIFETGMRIAEATRLQLKNINGRRIDFTGKGQKPREVYLSPTTAQELAHYIRKHQIRDYLWCTQGKTSHRPPTVETIRRRLSAPFRAAGFTDFYPHALRHSFATDLQLKGASLAEIKEMLGHESIATTERYLHGLEGKLEALFDKYH